VINETFKMNGKDFSQYVYYLGITESGNEVKGLPDRYTLDGTLHDDYFGTKYTHIYALNPVTEVVRKAIEAEYNSSNIFLTYYDKALGADKTVLCKPIPITWRKLSADPDLYQSTDLIFLER